MLFRRKERLIRPDDNTSYVYYLNQGYLRQYALSSEGAELTMNIFSANSIIPLSEMYDDSMNRYYYESLTPVEVFRMPKNIFFDNVNNNAEALKEINLQLATYTNNKLRKLESRIFDNAYKQLIFVLTELAGTLGDKESNKVIIKYWFTHQDLATIAGLSRERVTKQMNELVKKGLIGYKDRFIVINDLQKLDQEIQ